MKEAIEKTKQHIRKQGISLRNFATLIGYDASELSKILQGKRTRMSVEAAARIEIGTGGKVKIPMWINDEELATRYRNR